MTFDLYWWMDELGFYVDKIGMDVKYQSAYF